MASIVPEDVIDRPDQMKAKAFKVWAGRVNTRDRGLAALNAEPVGLTDVVSLDPKEYLVTWTHYGESQPDVFRLWAGGSAVTEIKPFESAALIFAAHTYGEVDADQVAKAGLAGADHLALYIELRGRGLACALVNEEDLDAELELIGRRAMSLKAIRKTTGKEWDFEPIKKTVIITRVRDGRKVRSESEEE